MTTAPQPFAATRWTLVLSAAQGGEQARPALAELCQLYWEPLRAYTRRCGFDAHAAEDLTQDFFARLLAKEALSKGKFRSFLLASLKNFLANQWDKTSAQKRGGHLTAVPLNEAELPAQLAPDPSFDKEWALAILQRVMTRLAEQYAGDKQALFDALKPGLTGEAPDYAEIGRRLGLGPGAVKVAAHRLRKRFGALLRAEVAQTVASPTDVHDELRYLLSYL